MTKMFEEISSQPQVLRGLKACNAAELERIGNAVKSEKIKGIVYCARGSSNNACVYFKYICEIYCGLPVSDASPSVYTMYNGNMDLNGYLVIGVSQSGKAADVNAVLERANSQGAITVGITNYPDSLIAKTSRYHIFLNAGEEISVAATKTFTAQFYALLLLAQTLSGAKALTDALGVIPDKVQRVIDNAKTVEAAAKQMSGQNSCFVLARGTNYAAALEAALKLQETSYFNSSAFRVSVFHHGPFAMVDESSNIIILMPQGESYKDVKEMYDKCAAQNANILLLTDNQQSVEQGGIIKIPSGTDIETPFYNVVTMQIFANALSGLRGLNPDNPRGLKKVTVTL